MGLDSSWFGILRPFRRDKKADFAAAGGVEAVKSAVGEILGTRGASEFSQGELPWRPEIGSHLDLLRHQRSDAVLQELARVYVVDALKRWEPQVWVRSVQVMRERYEGEEVLAIRLRYDIVTTSTGNRGLYPNVEQTVRLTG